MKNYPSLFSLLSISLLVLPASSLIAADGWQSGIRWLEPPAVDPGATNSAPPEDAVVLFDGSNLSAWKGEGNGWKIEDRVLVTVKGKGSINSKQEFGDCQLHIEWSAPETPEGDGQRRGNSGLFMMSKYEIQILDSYKNATYFDGQAAAVYKQTPPMVNAMRPPGQWNTYDVVWTAPRFDEVGKLQSPAYVTVFHNGVLVLNHFELRGDTPYTRAPMYKAHSARAPIRIQEHGNTMRFRNIWVRETSPPARN